MKKALILIFCLVFAGIQQTAIAQDQPDSPNSIEECAILFTIGILDCTALQDQIEVATCVLLEVQGFLACIDEFIIIKPPTPPPGGPGSGE